VTGSDDNTVRLWNPPSRDILKEARARVGRNMTQDEWKHYVPRQPYRKTFPDLPPGK
jgi:hypothetical protein